MPATSTQISTLAVRRSLWINAPGQSGAPGSRHFADLARPWSAGEYFPMAFSDAAVQAAAETTLTLLPR